MKNIMFAAFEYFYFYLYFYFFGKYRVKQFMLQSF